MSKKMKTLNFENANTNIKRVISKMVTLLTISVLSISNSTVVRAEEVTSYNIVNMNTTEELAEDINNSNYLIIDTDYASDADDVVALEIASAYAANGLLDIKAVCLSTTYSRSVQAVYNHLSSKGLGYVPVGMDTLHGVQVGTKYVYAIYNGGSTEYMQCTELYRKVLAESDKKVNIITLGFTQNIEDLLKSQPDKYSSLNGMELVAEKVDTLYIVGGNDEGRPSFNYWFGKNRNTTDSAKFVVQNFPSRIVFFQEEMVQNVWCASFYNSEDKKEKNLVTKALKANNQQNGLTCDPFAIYCAMSDMNNLLLENFIGLEDGIQYVCSNGSTSWIPVPAEQIINRQRFVKIVQDGTYSNRLDTKLREVMIK